MLSGKNFDTEDPNEKGKVRISSVVDYWSTNIHGG